MKIWSHELAAVWEVVPWQIAVLRTPTVDAKPVRFAATRRILLRACVAFWELAWAHRALMLFLMELVRGQTTEKFVWKVRA